jgi:membrane-associated protease RseP (regulator of RpoE activity)
MSILFAHEMGHYLTCRYYGIDASLPYFIPFPSLVGTLGAFIRIRGPFQHRSALLQMGIAGPIAGFVVAVPTLILGLSWSRVVPLTAGEGGHLGDPLILKLVVWLLGKTPSPSMDIYLHPVAFAAWCGFFVTALNLIPASQLDGGHVIYALFRRGHRYVTFAVMAVLAPLGLLYWDGWLIWLVLLSGLGYYVGFNHPPSLDDSIPLLRRDIVLGVIALALFILCFVPAPFY